MSDTFNKLYYHFTEFNSAPASSLSWSTVWTYLDIYAFWGYMLDAEVGGLGATEQIQWEKGRSSSRSKHCRSRRDSSVQFSSVQFTRSVVSDSLRLHESQHARPPCPSSTPGVHSESRPLSQWCHPAISSLVIPFSSCPQSLPASESFPKSQLFAWGGQSTGASALASFLPKNTQDWSPSEWTSWISLQSKGLSRVFSNTTVQKHQFFRAQLSSQSNSHIHTWPLEKP